MLPDPKIGSFPGTVVTTASLETDIVAAGADGGGEGEGNSEDESLEEAEDGGDGGNAERELERPRCTLAARRVRRGVGTEGWRDSLKGF
jgi:hypothetical protein